MHLRFRQLIAVLLYAAFGAGSLAGEALLLPIVALRLHRIRAVQGICRDLVSLWWRFFIRLTKFARYLDYEFSGISRPNAGTIIVANHPSLLDIVFLISHFRRATCVVKASLMRNPFLFIGLRACGYIPNTDNEAFLRASVQALQNGEILIIFPEGTRTRGDIEFHKAGAYIAIHGARQIQGIFIDMHPRTLRKNDRWWRVPERVVKYKFSQIYHSNLDEIKGNSTIIRVRKLHKLLNEIYKDEHGKGR